MNLRFSAIVALLPYLFSILLPFFAAYHVPSAEAADNYFAVDGKILICTVDGFEWLSLDDLADGSIPESDEHLRCGLCLLTANGIAFAALQDASVLSVSLFTSLYETWSGADSGAWVPPYFLSPVGRAPPVV